ncbi:MAG: hypothetical protein QOK40_2004, partial [Miltoncostaeaceae bacterium]|nr:hypothetical protein [Miltoncostaeaceae bacterium]
PPRPAPAWRPPRPTAGGRPVALVADTFTRYLHPAAGDAAVRVLTAAGASVQVVDPGCCGRALLSQGLVSAARRTARRALDRLAPHALAGRPIVVLEPSCWSMLADDLPDLLPDDPRARWVAESARTFERALLDLGGLELRPAGETDVLVHAHCHARALGGGADALAALRLLPHAIVRESGAGCCGMAGAFGLLHPELSRRIAEQRLAPAARAAGAVVAAGSSCRAQVERTTGRPALHPAEHLAAHLP